MAKKKIHNPSFRHASPVLYSFDHETSASFDTVHGLVAEFFKDSKLFPIRFQLGIYQVFVPQETWEGVKGLMKLPKEIGGIEGKIWKKVRAKAVVYNPAENIVDFYINDEAVETYEISESKNSVFDLLNGKKAREVLG